MYNGFDLAAWEAETIRNLTNTPGVSLELLIGDADVITPIKSDYSGAQKQLSILKKALLPVIKIILKLKKFASTSFWIRYQRFTNKYYPASCDNRISMSYEFRNIDMLFCRTIRKGKYSQYFTEDDLDKIRTYNLDLIIRFGFNIIRGPILEVPKYGVWSFHHGDYLKYRGGPPGFWEIYFNDPWSGAILQRLTDKLDDGIMLYSSSFKTNFTSYNKNKNNLFWGTTKWPSTVCRNILNENDESIFKKSEISTAPIYRAPTNLQTLRFIFKTIANKIETSFPGQSPKNRELWAVGIIDKPVNTLINSLQPVKIEWLEPPAGRFYADPFIIKKDNNHYLFIEDFSYSAERGRISVIETVDFKTYSEPTPAIEQPFHLSYPFIVEHEGEYYCIPEQCESGEIALYQAKSFPFDWYKKTTLVADFPGVDPTLIQKDGLWWMFTANHSDHDSSKLYLFYADHLEGPWTPHRLNPVKQFPQKTRPAGRIFTYNNRLIRPSQNCTATYGGSTIFNEITKLTKTEYQEIYIGELFPNIKSKFPDGLHHISPEEDITIVDGKRWIKK